VLAGLGIYIGGKPKRAVKIPVTFGTEVEHADGSKTPTATEDGVTAFIGAMAPALPPCPNPESLVRTRGELRDMLAGIALHYSIVYAFVPVSCEGRTVPYWRCMQQPHSGAGLTGAIRACVRACVRRCATVLVR
jgi:hypothetical protein